jgi:hypothetical protein
LIDAKSLRDKYIEISHTVSGHESNALQSGTCPDQLVGSIGDFDGDAASFPLRESVTRLDNYPCIVLVMESPHIDEFIGDWGPAKGKTGVQIRRHIATIVADLGGQLSELILVNAIQHQCSLGVPTDRYRDTVFRNLWANGGAADFERRLTQIYRPGDMLFNCCTEGAPCKGLRQLVTVAIRNSLGAVPLHSGPHPFAWFSTQNRRAVRLVAAQQPAATDAASRRS